MPYADPQKKKEYDAAYQRRRPEISSAANKRWRRTNREKDRAIHQAWDAAHPEKVVERQRRWRQKNRDKIKLYPSNSPQRVAFKAAMRRAAKSCATPPWLSAAQRTAIRDFYMKCPAGFHVDHVMPLRGKTTCGLHVPWNLQYLPAADNIRKGNKILEAC